MKIEDELSQPLKFLKAEISAQKLDAEFVPWIDAVLLDKPGIIDELKKRLEQSNIGFYRDIDKKPYYHLLLAYAYYRHQQLDQATLNIEQAETAFRIEEEKHCQTTVSSWFLGLLLCEQGKMIEAEKKRKEIEQRVLICGKKLRKDHPGNHKYESITAQINQSFQAVKEAYQVQNQPARPQPEPPKKPETRPMWIPTYRIYGLATAGSQGEPFLGPTDETVSASGIDHQVIIQNQEYRVTPTHAELNFPHPNPEARFGWLKVIGVSMNAAPRTPINHCSYVLFQENHDPSSCLKEIVVADQIQPPQLVIKRLVQIGNDYFLRSESSFEYDPLTGKSFQEDLEVVRDNQIHGIVIAVATPVECPFH